MKTRHFLVVFPLILSSFAFIISSFAEFSLHPEFLNRRITEISKDYFPAPPLSILDDCKSKHQVPLWHVRSCLQTHHRTCLPQPHFSSAEISPSSATSDVALGTVMRCWSSLESKKLGQSSNFAYLARFGVAYILIHAANLIMEKGIYYE